MKPAEKKPTLKQPGFSKPATEPIVAQFNTFSNEVKTQ
jgi:hypothetical protein